MPKKYHIPTTPIPPRQYPVGKYGTVEFREECAGSCRKCVKKKCVYNIFADNYYHMAHMGTPEYLYTCNSCFRCVQECTKGIFSRVINPDYRILGDHHWTPDIIHRTWYQAHTGSIPVSGAGYRGPFTGVGFDSMWTDMSEIVRPTRDGIHGREYINTMIELSSKPKGLSFNPDGTLATEVGPILESPIPMIFGLPNDFGIKSDAVVTSIAKAADAIDAFVILPGDGIPAEAKQYSDHIIPHLASADIASYRELILKSPMVSIDWSDNLQTTVAAIKSINQTIPVCVTVTLDDNSADRAVALSDAGIDLIHFAGSSDGKTHSPSPEYLRDAIQEIHLALVGASARLKINMVFSGGIAMAEHVVKAIICGADGVVLDTTLLVALECRVCKRCTQGLSCKAELDIFDTTYGAGRIQNLMGAWRNQILEMLGAMGIREVRRLRGEVGRSMWFENLEREIFKPIFGQKADAGTT